MSARPPHLPDFARLLHELSAFAAGGKIEAREIRASAPPPITLLNAPPVSPPPRASRRAGQILRQMRRRAVRLFRSGNGK